MASRRPLCLELEPSDDFEPIPENNVALPNRGLVLICLTECLVMKVKL